MWDGFGGAVVGVGWSWWGRVTCPENCQCQHYKTEAQVVGILKVCTSPNGMTKINSPFLAMPGFWRASVHPLLCWESDYTARPPSPSLMTKGSESPLRKVRAMRREWYLWQNFQLNAKTEAAFNMIEGISKRVVSREVEKRCLIIFTSPTSTSASMTRTTYYSCIWPTFGFREEICCQT